MAYPKPLEFDDRWAGFEQTVQGSLQRTFREGGVAKITLTVPGELFPVVFLSPTTRDALIDWLVAQREAERAVDLSECDGFGSKVPAEQLYHRFSSSGETDQCAKCLGTEEESSATLRDGRET